ncbi:M20/M25/M40 family metallo-hydrolase [Pseudomaricurvus alkylphenolicus]|uniref:M28 family metallopeptidase n=1 Tax=Pseudomaricurvus alkylphenolicus TaxID=1306991 RepID=UPI00141E2865|nr:M28 family metallopeptidase [Pseudomaricurvus alkylphenolicus]NIB38479.1 M20/M25/M40 family metallo-hydrolase [Pseudomaricurvus alkylphenolicus]
MKNHLRIVVLPLMILAIYGCKFNTDIAVQSAPKADADRLKAHVEFLADDVLEGRGTGSKGYKIAANYVAAEFAKLKVKPAGDGGSYFQSVPMRRALVDRSSVRLTIADGHNETELKFPGEFVPIASASHKNIDISAPLVFAGYGIESDLLNHHDYRDLDAKGKIVVILSGQPRWFPSEEGAHFGNHRERYLNAVKAGAVGLVTVQTPDMEKRSPYSKASNQYLNIPRFRWVKDDNSLADGWPEIMAQAHIDTVPASKLFVGAKMSLEDVFSSIEQGKQVAGFDLAVSMSLKSSNTISSISSSNVLGVIEGSDPELKNEYVVYNAHLDHLGQTEVSGAGEIYNGALDNASGVAVMLEVARIFSESRIPPKRSILFAAVTGEEAGLLGADYFVNNPTVPSGSMVATINLDMPFLFYPLKSVIAFGSEHSSLGGIAEQVLAKLNMQLEPDPWPERALFVRSDHYEYVRKGIPSVFLTTGTQSSDPDVNAMDLILDFAMNHYHRPTDNLELSFDWQAARTFSELSLLIGEEVANRPQRPYWHEGSFFGDNFSGGHSNQNWN